MKRIIIVLISLLAIGSLFASQLYEEGNIGEGALLSSSIEYYSIEFFRILWKKWRF